MVVVALLVLVMAILVGIFRSATEAISTQRAYAALSQDLRRFDTTIRDDLLGVTARMTPPLNPELNLGYFTYSEGALADAQGEDTDDILAFTTKAPQGRPFTGTITLPIAGRFGAPQLGVYNRVPITSDYAEIVYFMRGNGNLYRRVFLIQPERQDSIHIGTDANGAMLAGGGYSTSTPPASSVAFVNPNTGIYQLPVSWLGLNDLSARPSRVPPALSMPGSDASTLYNPILNTLGDLTNRENRAFTPRFANDYFSPKTLLAHNPDGIVDDMQMNGGNEVGGDGLPDFYPTLYPALFSSSPPLYYFPIGLPSSAGQSFDQLAFPFLYPHSYSQQDPYQASNGLGAIHSLDPLQDTNGWIANTPVSRPFFGSFLDPPYNHNPVDLGDNLPVPAAAGQLQTWWGLPTKVETMSPFWTDPVKRPNDPTGAPYFSPSTELGAPTHDANDVAARQSLALSPFSGAALPPMTAAYRVASQGYTDGLGSTEFASATSTGVPSTKLLVEEDLILTGVRSFDVKAYDSAAGGYYDLGYLSGPTGFPTVPAGNFGSLGNRQPGMYNQTPINCVTPLGTVVPTLTTFGHEGRMPPLTTDNRVDAQFPTHFIGDNDPKGVGILRMRRVFDTWSTAYTNVPSTTILNPRSGSTPSNGMPFSGKPPMPSYPPPYPAALRGIQIQIRVVDPKNQHLRTLTIRQDFTDNL
jgi:hypothetical protein